MAVIYIWKLIIWVVWGVLLVVLVLALDERLKGGSPVVARVATAFGLIWAALEIAGGMIATSGIDTVVSLFASNPVQATSLWLALDAVERGLGDGNLIVGGLWVLLVSSAALQAGELHKALNYLGLVIWAAGLLAFVPPLAGLGFIFGFGLILWFAWLGIVMLRGNSNTEEPRAPEVVTKKSE